MGLCGKLLTHWPLGDVAVISKVWVFNSLFKIAAWALSQMPQNLTEEKQTLAQEMAYCS